MTWWTPPLMQQDMCLVCGERINPDRHWPEHVCDDCYALWCHLQFAGFYEDALAEEWEWTLRDDEDAP